MNSEMSHGGCGPDGCEIDYVAIEAEQKLNRWLAGLQPIDYDAPGTSVREQGV